jgi:DHA1 family bicyclomycin/chloramphenicol resistance-like MFS transporter
MSGALFQVADGHAVALPVVALSGASLAGVLLAFFVLVASLGSIFPNATALALANIDTRVAGSASALLGVLQFSIGAVAAPLVGLGGETTAIPMAAAIAGFATAALVTFAIFCHRSRGMMRGDLIHPSPLVW